MIARTSKSRRLGAFKSNNQVVFPRSEANRRAASADLREVAEAFCNTRCQNTLRHRRRIAIVPDWSTASTRQPVIFRKNELFFCHRGKLAQEIRNELGLSRATTMTDPHETRLTDASRPLSADDITCRIAATYEERLAAFRLIYESYREKGLIEENEYEIRVTPYQLLPTTNVFIACHRGKVICTVTLIGDGELGLPMESIYFEEVQAERERGLVLGEVSSLAVRDVEFKSFLPIFIKLLRMMSQHARAYGFDQFMIATHPKHARFYKRFMGYEQIGGTKEYPSVCHAPAVACCLNFERIDRERPACYSQVFGIPVPPEQLRAQPMPDDEIELFQPASELAGECVPMMA